MEREPFLVLVLTAVGQNLQILADENRSLTVRYVVDDSVDRIKRYGAIRNEGVQVCRMYLGICGRRPR